MLPCGPDKARRSLSDRVTRFALAIVLSAGSACGGDATGPTVHAPNARLVFLDNPSDAISGTRLPPLRVHIVGLDRRPLSFANGRLEVALAGNPTGASLEGRVWYDLRAGEAIIDDLSIGQPGEGYALSATWNDVTGLSRDFAIVEDYDAIRVAKRGERSVGLLISGGDATGAVVEQAVVAEADVVQAGLLRSAPSLEANRVVAFARDRSPALVQRVPWTPGIDTAEVVLRDRSPVHLSVWFVHGGLAFMESLVFQALLDAEVLWAEERLGLMVGLVEIIDATEHPAAELFRDREATAGFMDSLQTVIGERPDRINVYSVSRLQQGARTFAGVAELGGNAIALTPGGWSGAILAHELGHNFGLRHVDEEVGFDGRNVMFSRGGERRFFSEGQTFRIHFTGESALHYVSGRPTTLTGDRIPPLDLRLWGDEQNAPVSARYERRIEEWLRVDCGVSDGLAPASRSWVDPASRASLQAASTEGPGPDLISRLEETAAARFDRAREYLRDNPPAWLGSDDLERLRTVSRGAYVAEAVSRFERAYRERAEAALSMGAADR
jgi:hypothetical protein